MDYDIPTLTCCPINPDLPPVENKSYNFIRTTQATYTDDVWINFLKRKFNHSHLETQADFETVSRDTSSVGCFAHALKHAYNNHLDFILSPDDIWMIVSLKFAKYMDENAEKVRKLVVDHEGKIELTVTDNHLDGQSRWDDFFLQMKDNIGAHTNNNIVDTLMTNFTSSTLTTQILSISSIMHSFQKYFSYGRCIPLCGIRNIYFMGEVADWLKISDKLDKLNIYPGFETYVSNVKPIIVKFLDSIQGNIDVDWWNRMFNAESGRLGSGSTTYISGWILNLYGLTDVTLIEQAVYNAVKSTKVSTKTGKYEMHDLDLEKIYVPVKVDDKSDSSKSGTVYIIGGFYGYNLTNGMIRPAMSVRIVSDLTTRPGFDPSKPYVANILG